MNVGSILLGTFIVVILLLWVVGFCVLITNLYYRFSKKDNILSGNCKVRKIR